MKDFESIFNWINLNQARARFSGGIRGADEIGHETFAVENDSGVYYGEIKKSFLPDKCNYNLEIVSFGYFDIEDVGGRMKHSIVNYFSEIDAGLIQGLITDLISDASTWGTKPSVMSESEQSRFMGVILFRNAWALINNAVLEATV